MSTKVDVIFDLQTDYSMLANTDKRPAVKPLFAIGNTYLYRYIKISLSDACHNLTSYVYLQVILPTHIITGNYACPGQFNVLNLLVICRHLVTADI